MDHFSVLTDISNLLCGLNTTWLLRYSFCLGLHFIEKLLDEFGLGERSREFPDYLTFIASSEPTQTVIDFMPIATHRDRVKVKNNIKHIRDIEITKSKFYKG